MIPGSLEIIGRVDIQSRSRIVEAIVRSGFNGQEREKREYRDQLHYGDDYVLYDINGKRIESGCSTDLIA